MIAVLCINNTWPFATIMFLPTVRVWCHYNKGMCFLRYLKNVALTFIFSNIEILFKIPFLCSTEDRKSYRFGAMWARGLPHILTVYHGLLMINKTHSWCKHSPNLNTFQEHFTLKLSVLNNITFIACSHEMYQSGAKVKWQK